LNFSLVVHVVDDQVVVHGILGGRIVHMLLHRLIKENFHLLLQESVELCFKLLLLLFGLKASMIDLFVVFLNSKPKDGFFKLLSESAIKL
jgi:hypothetical protein